MALLSATSLAPLKEKEYRLFITGRFFYIMALRMVGTIVAYKLYQITRDTFSIGLVGLAEFVPVSTLALYAGYHIDRSDKRKLLVQAMSSYALCALLLVLVTVPALESKLTVSQQSLCFYGIIFLTGIIRAFGGPTSHAIISQLVPRSMLPFAANISSTTWLSASILGHASAGFFIAGFGVNITLMIVLGYVVVATFITSRISSKPVLHNPAAGRVWASVKEGLRYVVHNKILLGAMSLDLFAVLFGGAVALIPEFAERILQVGPVGFGWLNAAIDIGSITSIILMTLSPMKRQQGRKLLWAVAGFGACIIGFGLSNVYWISFACLVVAGMLDGISVVVRGTILQLTTPDEMRGRVGSVNSLFINSSNELGQFESGFVARAMGTVPSVIFGGCMTILVVIVTAWKAPGLRKFEY